LLGTLNYSAGREFQTPNFDATPSVPSAEDPTAGDEREQEIERLASKHSLDSFQQKFTSQDNASFVTIMEEETEVKKKQWWWREGDPQKQLLIDASQERLAVTWKPDHYNTLMFPPKVRSSFSNPGVFFFLQEDLRRRKKS
jgi:hypothetical protein